MVPGRTICKARGMGLLKEGTKAMTCYEGRIPIYSSLVVYFLLALTYIPA